MYPWGLLDPMWRDSRLLLVVVSFDTTSSYQDCHELLLSLHSWVELINRCLQRSGHCTEDIFQERLLLFCRNLRKIFRQIFIFFLIISWNVFTRGIKRLKDKERMLFFCMNIRLCLWGTKRVLWGENQSIVVDDVKKCISPSRYQMFLYVKRDPCVDPIYSESSFGVNLECKCFPSLFSVFGCQWLWQERRRNSRSRFHFFSLPLLLMSLHLLSLWKSLSLQRIITFVSFCFISLSVAKQTPQASFRELDTP